MTKSDFKSQSVSSVLPVPDLWSEPFWDFASRGELALQRCQGCGSYRYPSAPICPVCWSMLLEWQVVSGRGKVRSWVVFHQDYYQGASFQVPYNVATVALEEGPTMISNLVEIENSSIYAGLAVEVVFRSLSSKFKLPQFRPVSKVEANV